MSDTVTVDRQRWERVRDAAEREIDDLAEKNVTSREGAMRFYDLQPGDLDDIAPDAEAVRVLAEAILREWEHPVSGVNPFADLRQVSARFIDALRAAGYEVVKVQEAPND